MLLYGFPDVNTHEEPGTVRETEDEQKELHFSLHNPIAELIPCLTWIKNDNWISMLSKRGYNTMYMTFPFCHGKLMQKIGHSTIQAYDIWMLNEITNVYEPIAIWCRKQQDNDISDWISDSFDFWFEKGEGMIGKVGDRRAWNPNKEHTLDKDPTFLRHQNAKQAGLNRGDAVWFRFQAHRFVLGYYTSDNWIDEKLRATILETNSKRYEGSSHEEGSAMDIDPPSTGSRICLQEVS